MTNASPYGTDIHTTISVSVLHIVLHRCSFVIIGKKHRFFFAGDSGYCPVFKEIGEVLGPFDLAALPIGTRVITSLGAHSLIFPSQVPMNLEKRTNLFTSIQKRQFRCVPIVRERHVEMD